MWQPVTSVISLQDGVVVSIVVCACSLSADWCLCVVVIAKPLR